ncbi:DEAD/DEAH box helicase [Thiomicrospira sp. WB1]|uniref:DEAD/DEAH box helicase n=1 Tax=Thiomicrospira sp. WB1 TaxID=1685380 RepID=UPI000746DCBC|nr:DEAD/DEAH box helicase [Thiomicrospira sp. WB1]KUJ71450.1 DEAD/DEAH box helicase [Thiomicrospira sp. WB1]
MTDLTTQSADPKDNEHFEDLGLDPCLLSALNAQHFHRPTPIQAAAIPLLLEERDLLAGAATGTGKTAAFVLPALQRLLDVPRPSRHPRVLILAPTRELAFQTHKVVKQLGHFMECPSMVITGGLAADRQLAQLKQPLDILVATPGRLLKLMADAFIDLSDLELVIIDEADRMLDMGQGPDVLALLEAIPRDFQAGCFSATLGGKGLKDFARQVLDAPEVLQLDAPNQQSQQVQQTLYLADSREHKRQLLLAILQDPTCQRALVFYNKKDRAMEEQAWLTSQGIDSLILHGDMIQAKRLQILKRFRQGQPPVLVATDVAARGLDVDNITHVVNADMPFRGDQYIHRIGRTGRGHQAGVAFSLIERHDIPNLQRIEYHLQQTLPTATIEGLEARFSRKDIDRRPKKTKKKKQSARSGKKKTTKKPKRSNKQ